MVFYELLEKRQSIRSFKKDSIPPEIIQRIFKAIQSAPSAGNRQAYKIVQVFDPTIKTALARAAWNQNFIAAAPFVLVFFADVPESSGRYGDRGNFYALQDATIACAYAQLAITAEGLGSVWIGAFNDNQVHNILHAPSGLKPVAILPIGYPAEKPRRTPRKVLSQVLVNESFSEK
ncbi:MAG: nitroreductase family protein [Promethearchaeota archaeon]